MIYGALGLPFPDIGAFDTFKMLDYRSHLAFTL